MELNKYQEADEIRERLKIFDMDQKAQACLYGTFHGIALKLLQDVLPVQELGYTREFQVCLPEEELELATRLIKEHSLKSFRSHEQKFR